MKILLQGYYGFGNLGDDLLLKVIFEFTVSKWSGSEIYVFSNADSSTNRYLHNLLNDKITIINYSYRGHFDLIINGGGGTHYDYDKGSYVFALLNLAIRIIGYKRYVRLYQIRKKWKGKELITRTQRLGVGIGVGTFTKSSRKFHSNIPILADYDHLYVRDHRSQENALKYLKAKETSLSTDLAFASDLWLTSTLNYNPRSGNIGIVLRRWDKDFGHLEAVINAGLKLKQLGYSITIYFFEKAYDLPIIGRFKDLFATKTWDPATLSLKEFLTDFGSNELIVTSRFHGSLIAAALNIPSIAIGVEPKLYTISGMLPSVPIMDLPLVTNELLETIQSIIEHRETQVKKLKNEFEHNKAVLLKSFEEIKSFLGLEKT